MTILLLVAALSVPGTNGSDLSASRSGVIQQVSMHADPPNGGRNWVENELRYGVLGRNSAPVGMPGHAVPTAIPDAEGRSGFVREAGSPSGARSVALAFGLSAIVPGAGQAYNRQWVKAGVALSLEALVAVLWAGKRSDGLAAEDDVVDFAHARWSAARYASWLNDYVVYLEQTFDHNVTAPPAVVPTTVDFAHPEAWSAADRAEVNRFFSQIQAIERQVYHPETGATFSHQLPGFAEQQYYELIGKYFQFAPGWDDYPVWVDIDGAFTPAIDPEMTGEANSKPNVSPTFRLYAREHAHSQDLLRSASRLSMLFIVNHLIAAVDGAVSAKLHNDRLSTRTGLSMAPDGEIVPMTSVAFRF